MAKAKRPGQRAVARGPQPARPNSGRITRDAFPRVVSFFRGYLNEDFVQEYGSAIEARAAFLGDCERAEQLAFRAECARLAAALTALGLPEARRVLTQVLGSAWSPASLEDIKALLAPAPRA